MLGNIGILSVAVIVAGVIFIRYQPDAVGDFWSRISAVFNSDDDFVLPEGETLFTVSELSKFNGEKEGPYLAILGRVYDVTPGVQHYGPGGAYNQFAGRDASRSYVTGDFSPEGLTDDVSDFTAQQMFSIHNWLHFYETDYKHIGRLIGRYYDKLGKPTETLLNALALIKEAQEKSEREAEERKQFPSCNSEWSEPSGGRVWCSPKSGGIEREWPGVPRQLFNPNTGDTRCVCVHSSHLENPNLREYSGCDTTAVSCAITE